MTAWRSGLRHLPTGGKTQGLSRSFATLHVQPFTRFSIDVNHHYFRDVPTFDPALVGTGLLDKYLAAIVNGHKCIGHGLCAVQFGVPSKGPWAKDPSVPPIRMAG